MFACWAMRSINHCYVVSEHQHIMLMASPWIQLFMELIWKMACMVRTWCLWPIVSQGTRVFVHLALLLVFLYFFGMPAVVRFAKKEVMIVETTRQTNGIPLPAITISVPHQITDHSCFERNSSIESCLGGIVLNRSDILKSVVLGYQEKNEII